MKHIKYIKELKSEEKLYHKIREYSDRTGFKNLCCFSKQEKVLLTNKLKIYFVKYLKKMSVSLVETNIEDINVCTISFFDKQFMSPSLEIFISKYSDEYFGVEIYNNIGKVGFKYKVSKYLCDQMEGLLQLIDDLNLENL